MKTEHNIDLFIKALNRFSLPCNRTHVSAIVTESENAKSELDALLRCQPTYDGNGRVIISENVNREVDMMGWNKAQSWLITQIEQNLPYEESNLPGLSMGDAKSILRELGFYVRRNKASGNYIPEGEDSRLNDVFAACNSKTRCAAGQKFTKIITKFVKEIGLDKIKDVRDDFFYDNNGIMHKRQKDFGWNYYQALIGDSLNIIDVPATLVLSVNPLDILTMSCGTNWASCHFFGVGSDWKGRDTYSGCYSGGNIGLIEDKVSMICYFLNNGVDPEDWEEGKSHRAMFAYENGVLYEGRVYPDGRDGGDNTLAQKMRAFVQKVIAEGLHENNIWDTKRGTEYSRRYVEGDCDYIGYQDWNCCPDSVISFLRSESESRSEMPKIRIGARSVCPSCGYTHNNEKCVCCEDCKPAYDDYCENCGEGIPEGEGIYVDSNDCIYCCEECANRDGYYYCVDIDDYAYEDDIRYDDYEDKYYYHTEDGVYTEDGTWYHDWETAENAGYVYVEEKGEWYHYDKVAEAINDREMHLIDDMIKDLSGNYFYEPEVVISKNGVTICFETESEAEDAGYHCTVTGEWTLDEEEEVMVC